MSYIVFLLAWESVIHVKGIFTQVLRRHINNRASTYPTQHPTHTHTHTQNGESRNAHTRNKEEMHLFVAVQVTFRTSPDVRHLVCSLDSWDHLKLLMYKQTNKQTNGVSSETKKEQKKLSQYIMQLGTGGKKIQSRDIPVYILHIKSLFNCNKSSGHHFFSYWFIHSVTHTLPFQSPCPWPSHHKE